MAASTSFISFCECHFGADPLADATNMMAEYSGFRRTIDLRHRQYVNEIRYGGRCAKSTGRTQYKALFMMALNLHHHGKSSPQVWKLLLEKLKNTVRYA